jgi:hypothetical protein
MLSRSMPIDIMGAFDNGQLCKQNIQNPANENILLKIWEI